MNTKVETQIQVLKIFNTLEEPKQASLLADLKRNQLFTPAHASAKLAKNRKFKRYESYILYMSPADLAFKFIGRNGTLCPFASDGCKVACLNTAGRGRFDSVAQARLRKSLYYINARENFVQHVFSEVSKLRAKTKRGKILVIRLNGTTDIPWTQLTYNEANIFDTFKDVQFYDYTKNLQYALKAKAQHSNYHVTFSASECNTVQWQTALDRGINVAMVFDKTPTEYYGVQVINGDDHDLRFLDVSKGSGVIVGLTAKGKAKQDKSGFVKSACSIEVAA